jgi:hypothetical protein
MSFPFRGVGSVDVGCVTGTLKKLPAFIHRDDVRKLRIQYYFIG